MRVRTDPLTLAAALGLLGPVALGDGGRLEFLEISPDEEISVTDAYVAADTPDASPADPGISPAECGPLVASR